MFVIYFPKTCKGNLTPINTLYTKVDYYYVVINKKFV